MGTAFNTPSTRVPRSKDIPTWDAKLGQWVPQRPPLTVSTTVTSTGAVGVYALNFATPFKTPPVVVANVGAGVVQIIATTTTGFSFNMSNYGAAWAAATVVSLMYIAIGT